MFIIKGRDLFNIRFVNLADNLFLLFNEGISMNDLRLNNRDWSSLGRIHTQPFGKVDLLLFPLFLESSEGGHFLVFFSFLFGVDVGDDLLASGFGRWGNCLWLNHVLRTHD